MINRVKITAFSLYFGMVIFAFAQPVYAQRLEGSSGNWRLTTMYDSDAEGASEIVFRNIVGQIQITGSTVSRISVVEVVASQSSSEPKALQDSRKNALTFVRSGNTIELFGGGQQNASYTISIPSKLAVRVDIASGNVEVATVNADVRVETGAGNVGMNSISGSASIRTGSGNITLSTMQRPVSVHTGAGNVTASDLGAGLDVTTGGGNVTARSIDGSLKVVTAGGRVSASSIGANAVLFTSGGNISANGVSGRLEASTSGGEIEVADISGRTDLSTNGGGITASNLVGPVRAETMAGDVVLNGIKNSFEIIAEVGNVSVSMNDASFLSSGDASIDGGYGNITLRIPATIHGVVSAVVSESGSVTFTGSESRVQVERERPTARGESIRRASYTFGKGGGRISINTRSGNIKITEKD